MPDKRQTIGAAPIFGISLWLIGILVTAVSAQKNDQSPKGATVVITTRHGEQLTGTLLFASDSALVLYNLQHLQVQTKIVPAAEIERIRIVRTGFDEHIDIAGNVAAYEVFLPKLRWIAAYYKLQPPKLYAIMQSSTQPSSSASVVTWTIAKPDSTSPPSGTIAQPAQTNRPVFRPPIARFHFALEAGGGSSRTKADLYHAFVASGFGGYREADTIFTYPSFYPNTSPNNGVAGLSAEYNLSSHVCLGLAIHKMPKVEVTGKDYEFEQVRGTFYNLFGKYVRQPAAPLFLSHFEFAFEAGISYGVVTVEGSLAPVVNPFGDIVTRPSTPTFAINKKVVGFYDQMSLDYYVIKRLSLQLNLFSMQVMTAVQVPEISERTFQGETKTLKSHALHLTGFETTFGVRLHF